MRGTPWGSWAPVEGDGEYWVKIDIKCDPRLCRRDRHVDGRLRDKVRIGLRRRDDLDRIGAALESGRGSDGDVAAAVNADRPAGRGVGRDVVSVGEAGPDVGRERDGRVLVGRERRRGGRDLNDVTGAAVERDRVGAVVVDGDRDRAGVTDQSYFVFRVKQLSAMEGVPLRAPELSVPPVEVMETVPEKLGEDIEPS